MELITRKDFKDNVGKCVYVTYVAFNKNSSTFFNGQLKPVKRRITKNNYSHCIQFEYHNICQYGGRNDEKIDVRASYDTMNKWVFWKFFTTKEEAEEYVKQTKEKHLEDIRKVLMCRKVKHLEAIKNINKKLFNLIIP